MVTPPLHGFPTSKENAVFFEHAPKKQICHSRIHPNDVRLGTVINKLLERCTAPEPIKNEIGVQNNVGVIFVWENSGEVNQADGGAC